jgi:hypothetical protein
MSAYQNATKLSSQRNGVLPTPESTSSVTDKAAVFQVLKPVVVALQRLFTPFCEVVVHDFSDFEHSIICIEGNYLREARDERSA